MAIKVTSITGVEPVTLEEIKLHCRIDHDDEDEYLLALIQTVRQYCETFTGRAIPLQVVEYTLDDWPPQKILYLPKPPVTEVLDFEYRLKDDLLYTGFTDFEADFNSEPARIMPSELIAGRYQHSWPSGSLHPIDGVWVQYTAGYINVPEYIKAAIKLYVGSLYENREAVLPAGHIGRTLPMGLDALLWQERVFWVEGLNK